MPSSFAALVSRVVSRVVYSGCLMGMLQLCEKKRELEVTAAREAAEAREKAVEIERQRIPEHQQCFLQVFR